MNAKSRTSRDPDQELFEFLNNSEVVVSKNDSPTQNVGPSSSTNRKSLEGLFSLVISGSFWSGYFLFL